MDVRVVLDGLGGLYCASLAVWAVMRFVLGDRAWQLFTLNSLAFYLFIPLPLVAVVATVTRRRSLWFALAICFAIWLYWWGDVFIPRLREVPPGGATLRVMTYNVLGSNSRTSDVVEVLREGNADIVALHELNIPIAESIKRDLADEYPYQLLEPRQGVKGYGVISRLPFEHSNETIEEDQWISPPTVVRLSVEGTEVTLVRFHAISHPKNHVARERQARKLAAFARAHQGPLVLLGDLNATNTNVAYEILHNVVFDAWREAGNGLGNTFPAASKTTTPGSSRPQLLGRPVPKFLVRIDYVFHSSHWWTVAARTADSDGGSDHRPVIAELMLKHPPS